MYHHLFYTSKSPIIYSHSPYSLHDLNMYNNNWWLLRLVFSQKPVVFTSWIQLDIVDFICHALCWTQVCQYWYDNPASSSTSTSSMTYSHSSGSCTPRLTLSLPFSNQCNYQPWCVFVAHGPALHHAEPVRAGVEGEIMNGRREESDQGRYTHC